MIGRCWFLAVACSSLFACGSVSEPQNAAAAGAVGAGAAGAGAAGLAGNAGGSDQCPESPILPIGTSSVTLPIEIVGAGAPVTTGQALASFVRVLVSGNSAYDRFRRGDSGALSDSAQRGRDIFEGERGQCTHCHVGFNFTNNAFRNNGTRPDDA